MNGSHAPETSLHIIVDQAMTARMLLQRTDVNPTSMNTRSGISHLPDSICLAPELRLGDVWDAGEIASLIRSKCSTGDTPAFLFLGQKEAALLRDHLAAVFGLDAVITLRDTYYMGLEVVEISCQSFFLTGGRKAVQTLQAPISRRPVWRDNDTETLWQLRI